MPGRITAVYQYRDPRVNDAYYASDEFRMFGFKILPCPRTRSHDWTDCPLAHHGEKAMRRDPSKFNYMAIACPYYKASNGECSLGETCCFAHGIFEYWLHPAKYRTRPCNMGRLCQRKVCFFAHGPDQLRTEIKYKVQWSNSNDNNKNSWDSGEAPVIKAIFAAPNGSSASALEVMSWEEMRKSTWENVIDKEKMMGAGVMDGTELIAHRMRDLSLVDPILPNLADQIDRVSQLLYDNLNW